MDTRQAGRRPPTRSVTAVYTYEPPTEQHPGLIREHIRAEKDERTLCGLTPQSEAPLNQGELDKGYDTPTVNWFYEIGEDVVITFDCRTCFKEGTDGQR